MSKQVKIAHLGQGSSAFGFMALTQAFSENGIMADAGKPKPVPCISHHLVCDAVGRLQAKFGVVAIENSIDGIVNDSVRAIAEADAHYGLSVCGETVVDIDMFYMMLSPSETPPSTVFSHRVALNQCGRFLDSIRKSDGSSSIKIEVCESTDEAARRAKEEPGTAALASRKAAETYGLKLIRPEPVNDHRSKTRFWILGKHHSTKKNGLPYKTAYLVHLNREASGVLQKSLGVFADNGISVCLVYPIPIIGKLWEYTFLIEVEGYVDDLNMIRAWHDFCSLGISLQPMQFLGSYAKATE